jgi:nickel/cobalt exporter
MVTMLLLLFVDSLVAIQHWLYGGMASGLGEVAGGNLGAILAAMAAAVLFGAVHALMPGNGKTVPRAHG